MNIITEFESRKTHDAKQVVTLSGEIKQRDDGAELNIKTMKQLALSIGNVEGEAVYWIEQGNDLIILIESETNWDEFPWQEEYDTISVIGRLHSNIRFKYAKCKLLDLNELDTSDVTGMSYMFNWCKAQSLDLSNFDTSNVINMSCMFDACKAQSLDLSNFDTSKVTDMSSMFYECEAQSLDLSNFDTSEVTDMSRMFCLCKAHSLDLSSFNTSNVTYMREMFEYCEARPLDLSSFDTSNVLDMDNMLYGCKAQYITCNDNRLTDVASARRIEVRRTH